MLVNWKREGLVAIPLIDIKNSTGLVASEKIIYLTPGWNEIPDDQWNIIQPHVVHFIERDELELFVKKAEKATDGTTSYEGQPLRDVRSEKAREIVKNTFNIEQLKTWSDDMKLTTEVRHLIDKQIELCEKGGPDAKGR